MYHIPSICFAVYFKYVADTTREDLEKHKETDVRYSTIHKYILSNSKGYSPRSPINMYKYELLVHKNI